MSKGEETRQAVLDQAVQTAARGGLAALTIGTLATQTGMSKSGLFAHFRSKEALQLQVLEYARDNFIDEVIRPAIAAPRGEERVRTLFEHWLEVSKAGSAECLFVSASWEFDDQPGAVRDQLVRDKLDFEDSIAQMFRTGIAEGHFRPDADPDQFAHDLHGVMLAHFHAHRLLGDPRAEAKARYAFEHLLADARLGDEAGGIHASGNRGASLGDAVSGGASHVDTAPGRASHADTASGQAPRLDTALGHTSHADTAFGRASHADTALGRASHADTALGHAPHLDTTLGQAPRVDTTSPGNAPRLDAASDDVTRTATDAERVT